MEIKAFTLIELLVVMTIMATLSGLIFIAYEGSDRDAVTQDAYELQTVLQRARTMAMSSGSMHAVTFHIENAGDGSVLKNRSENDPEDFPGRHWYCILGPDNSDLNKRASDKPPMALSTNGGYYAINDYTFLTLSDYVKAMKNVQAGPRHYLSPGVRFLALTDIDDIHRFDTHASYPRPWFGHYDPAEKRLYTWGGYDRDIDAGLNHPNTGLDYAGDDGEIPYSSDLDANINPPAVWGRIHLGATAAFSGMYVGSNPKDPAIKRNLGYEDVFKGPDTTELASTPGRPIPRPIVNGYWGDFMILFNAKGEASLAKGHCRPVYFQKLPFEQDNHDGRIHLGMENEELLSGGFAVTVCRDVDPDTDMQLYKQSNALTGEPAYNKFDTVEDAFASINPFLRIFVNRATGKAEVQSNEHPYLQIEPDDLLNKDPYPRGFD